MKRAIAGLMSLALMTGGILAAPTAFAAERAGTCNVDAGAPAQRGAGTMTADKSTYKPGDVVTLTGTGFRPLIDAYLSLDSNTANWPKDQSAGSSLKIYDDYDQALYLRDSDLGGSFTAKVVLPKLDDDFTAGKHTITLVGIDYSGRPTIMKNVEFWVNESGESTAFCGADYHSYWTKTVISDSDANPHRCFCYGTGPLKIGAIWG